MKVTFWSGEPARVCLGPFDAAKVHTFCEVAMSCPDLVTSKGRTALFVIYIFFYQAVINIAYQKKRSSRLINIYLTTRTHTHVWMIFFFDRHGFFRRLLSGGYLPLAAIEFCDS